jgi:hypothetical protein
MPPERILRFAALYHGVVGLVFVVLPSDALRSLGLEPPRYWLLYYLAVLAPLVAGGLLELARRKPELRPGIIVSVQAGNLVGMLAIVFFSIWSDLPRVLLGPGVAAALWAWLLGGVYSGPPSSDE